MSQNNEKLSAETAHTMRRKLQAAEDMVSEVAEAFGDIEQTLCHGCGIMHYSNRKHFQLVKQLEAALGRIRHVDSYLGDVRE